MENKHDASSLWNIYGQIPLLEYLEVKFGLTKREKELVKQLIKDAAEQLRDTYLNFRFDMEKRYSEAIAFYLKALGLDQYETIYFCTKNGRDVVDFPVTADIIAEAISRQDIQILSTEQDERKALIGSREFTLDHDVFIQYGPASAVEKSLEIAFLSGRTQDYAYVDALIRDGGRLKMPDYADIANWPKLARWQKPNRAYEAHDLNNETRFDVEHIKRVKGQVREQWILYDLMTGEQQEAKTFVQCRQIAREMSRRVSRYEAYAYRVGMKAFFRGKIVSIDNIYQSTPRIAQKHRFYKDPDEIIVARCTDPDGNEFDAVLDELYLREEDACLPGEEKKA